MSKINLIGLAGGIGSGKSTVGKIINNLTENKFKEKMFAYKLKQIASLITGVPVEKFEDQEFKKLYMGEEWKGKWVDYDGGESVPTYRLFLQKLGTEAIRDTIHPNAWCNALFSEYKELQKEPYLPSKQPGLLQMPNAYFHKECRSCGREYIGYKRQWRCGNCIELESVLYPSWVITDLRFANEAKAVTDRGGVTVHIKRDILGKKEDTHASENALKDYKFDYYLDNTNTPLEDLPRKVEEMLKYFGVL